MKTYVPGSIIRRLRAPFFLSLFVILSVSTFGGIVGEDCVFLTYDLRAPNLASREQMERRVFDLVNAERASNGLTPLMWIDKAADAARSHSEDMAANRYLSHYDLHGRKVSQRAEDAGLNDWRWLGENIAWLSGHSDPTNRVVENWMRSKGHRENILQQNFNQSGIGMAVSSDGKYYFTQVFVLRR
jgi:uncharacterized protein YkwD